MHLKAPAYPSFRYYKNEIWLNSVYSTKPLILRSESHFLGSVSVWIKFNDCWRHYTPKSKSINWQLITRKSIKQSLTYTASPQQNWYGSKTCTVGMGPSVQWPCVLWRPETCAGPWPNASDNRDKEWWNRTSPLGRPPRSNSQTPHEYGIRQSLASSLELWPPFEYLCQ